MKKIPSLRCHFLSFGLNDSCGLGLNGPEKYEEDLRRIFDKIAATGAECIFMTENMMTTYVSVHLTDEFFRELGESFADVPNDGASFQSFQSLRLRIALSFRIQSFGKHARHYEINAGGYHRV